MRYESQEEKLSEKKYTLIFAMPACDFPLREMDVTHLSVLLLATDRENGSDRNKTAYDPDGNFCFCVHISLFGLVAGGVYGVTSGNMVHAY